MIERFFARIATGPLRLPLVAALVTLAVGIVNYTVLVRSQAAIIEHEAVRVAEIVTDHALTARSVFTQVTDPLKNIVAAPLADSRMHPGAVPVPATFLKLVGEAIGHSNSGLYSYRPLSKWSQAPPQDLHDDFQRWGWRQLEQQDQANPAAPIDWQPVWRFEIVDGIRVLRYLRADPASSMTCVQCHNAMEASNDTVARRIAAGVAPGKQWRQHQLLGAIEANVPVDRIEKIASTQARMTLMVVLLSSLCGLATVAWLAMRGLRRERRSAEHFAHQANTDSLTRLANRALFNARAESALYQARGTGEQVALLFIDLNGFKQINDTHGHHAGDLVLCEVGRRLLKSRRESDVVARQGGDEFLILLRGSALDRNMPAVAEKVLEAVRTPIALVANGAEASVTASIGISYFPLHGASLATLMEKADTAMYHAKRQGPQGAFVVWDETLAADPAP